MFVVLFVCRGNICRSLPAEALLRRAVDPAVTVGPPARGGDQPVHPSKARLLTADGIDTSGFRSHRLTTSDVRDADLVLTLTAHRAQVPEGEPAGLRRTVSLGELARLASAVPAGTVDGVADAERLGSLYRPASGCATSSRARPARTTTSSTPTGLPTRSTSIRTRRSRTTWTGC